MESTKKSKRKKISDHISYKEATRSETATRLNISNIPNEDILKNMILVAEEVFEPLREWAKHAINVNSFYRSPKLNSAVRGSLKSSHLSGQAIDISTLGKKSNGELFDYIRQNLDFDQLIWEFGNDESPKWIHVSYKSKKENRKDVLKARYRGGRVTYFRM